MQNKTVYMCSRYICSVVQLLKLSIFDSIHVVKNILNDLHNISTFSSNVSFKVWTPLRFLSCHNKGKRNLRRNHNGTQALYFYYSLKKNQLRNFYINCTNPIANK